MYNSGLNEICRSGPFDQRRVENRDDVLMYTTPELEEDTEVTGPVVLKLYASTSGLGTDWVGRLTDVFKKGHYIRLQITSSNFPLWDRNLNTGELPHMGTEMKMAQQAIFHDVDHPSRLILPIV